MQAPRISIITPNFNKGEFLAACIKSVLDQTFADWEMIVVDDGSTDGSDAIGERWAADDDRIRFFRNPAESKGAAAARNLGLEKSRAELILFLDSDDLLHPECLEERIGDMDRAPELGYIVYPTAIFFRQVGDSPHICNVPTREPDLHRFLNRDIVWLISGPVWRRSALVSLDGFDPTLHSQQDFDLHVRALIDDVPYAYHHTAPKVFYRQEVDSLPRRHSQSVEHFRARHDMVCRHHRLLEKKNKLSAKIKELLARYLLDLAQMMRWHIAELGGGSCLRIAMNFWKTAAKFDLVDGAQYAMGKRYIRFKHAMIFNRFPRVQARLERRFRRKLDGLIFHPSRTYCKTTMSDYEK